VQASTQELNHPRVQHSASVNQRARRRCAQLLCAASSLTGLLGLLWRQLKMMICPDVEEDTTSDLSTTHLTAPTPSTSCTTAGNSWRDPFDVPPSPGYRYVIKMKTLIKQSPVLVTDCVFKILRTSQTFVCYNFGTHVEVVSNISIILNEKVD
jgi:hypothetical protein